MREEKNDGDVYGSFRDPSGFLFYRNSILYRQVNITYKKNYDVLMNSGLYESLVKSGLLIPHEEDSTGEAVDDKSYKIIKPEYIPFISYPYEWSFSQLKDAALTTLEIQKKSLDFGMSLKDCSAYNIQFKGGRPVFIDTLSFEEYREGSPWVAYRQFCQHFLSVLSLMCYRDIRLNQLLRTNIDGVPLDLASSLLPFVKTHISFPLLSHIHLHARSQKYFSDKTVETGKRKMSRLSLLGLIDNLESAISKLNWQAGGTEWDNYYMNTNYSPPLFEKKKSIISDFIDKCRPKTLWDLGANVGIFSRIASDKGIQTVSFDLDPACVEKNYLESVKRAETGILPLLLDLTNPSPGIGWANRERMSLKERGPADTVLALALIHHLAISNNLPFNKIAGFFSDICDSLIIEFVPMADSQVQKLLSTRENIFPDYNQRGFEEEFSKRFKIMESLEIGDSGRIIYMMKKRPA